MLNKTVQNSNPDPNLKMASNELTLIIIIGNAGGNQRIPKESTKHPDKHKKTLKWESSTYHKIWILPLTPVMIELTNSHEPRKF